MLLVLLTAVGLLLGTALAAALCGRADRAALRVGAVGGLLACVLGAGAALAALVRGASESVSRAWSLPVGAFHVGVDPLSAFFLLCVFVVSGLSALYGSGYLRRDAGKRRLAPTAALFNVLVASMAGVVLARDGVLFLMAWEVMSVASYFLVTYEGERPEVRRAGMAYLIASHAGVVVLFVLFALMARAGGSFAFDAWAGAGGAGGAAGLSAGLANAAFVLGVLGFGTKAGFWPLHVWLPDAHPAAPSHVSAVMSGVMIKMGIYGLLRLLTLLGDPPAPWGVALLLVGAISGVVGVLHALAQHDLKRLLAYHSVENIGIIAIGLGIGLLGQSHGDTAAAFLGYAGALLHVLNHGIFKSLLFLGAGSVLHSAGTVQVDALGGLQRRMPLTAATFLVGSVAISGLPPLNGFVSEWLIYVGAFRGGAALPATSAAASALAVPALALIGGLAAACFAKAFGVVFLGEPRTGAASPAHEAGPAMAAPMVLAAALCLAIGLWPAGALALVAPAARALAGPVAESAPAAVAALPAITRSALLLVGLVAALALLRRALLRRREVASGSTWACGYAATTPRMQYTGASFARLALGPFSALVHAHVHEERPRGYFPEAGSYEEHPADLAGERVIAPATRRFVRLVARLHVVQHGRIQLYLVYVLAALVILLVWQLAGGGTGHG